MTSESVPVLSTPQTEAGRSLSAFAYGVALVANEKEAAAIRRTIDGFIVQIEAEAARIRLDPDNSCPACDAALTSEAHRG